MMKKTLRSTACGLLSLSIIFAVSFLFAKTGFAASLLFSSSVPDGHVGLSQMFKVRVTLDPEGQVINSLETRISYPRDLLKLSAIEDGSSFLSMWLGRPNEKDGVISLSGIAPRGFNGNISGLEYSKLVPGDVVTLVFEPIKAGKATIGASSGVALLNDGLGSEAVLRYGSVDMTVGDYLNEVNILETDKTVPDFMYAETHFDPNLDGLYLFFVASDKDSGIDHYEIKDGDVWRTIQSPHLIKQNVGVYYIKAVDRVGNEKVKEILVPRSDSGLNKIFWLGAVLFLLFAVLIGRRILAKRKQEYL